MIDDKRFEKKDEAKKAKKYSAAENLLHENGISNEAIKKSTKEEFAKIRKGQHYSLLESRKNTLPEYNLGTDIERIDGFVDSIRKLDSNKKSNPSNFDVDAIWIKQGYTHKAKVSYPHSLGENGNSTEYLYKNKPTVEDIKNDLLDTYKEQKIEINKEVSPFIVAKSGRDENIEKAIIKDKSQLAEKNKANELTKQEKSATTEPDLSLTQSNGKDNTSRERDRQRELSNPSRESQGEQGSTGRTNSKHSERLARWGHNISDDSTGERSGSWVEYKTAGERKEGRGVLDEYFTPKEVIDKVVDLVLQYAEKPIKTVLEPSAGTGNFLERFKDKKITAFEINKETADIMAERFPNAEIINKPLETLFIDERGNKKVNKRKWDLVIGNPPYGSHRGLYKGLGEEPNISKYEDYFLLKSLEVVNEGGLVAMVLPSGFLKTRNYSGKLKIAQLGKLIDAYRLPNGIFKGTDVGTDIVIFRKDLSGDTNGSKLFSDDLFFQQNPDKVLGEEVEVSGRFGMEKKIKGDISAVEKIKTKEVEEVLNKHYAEYRIEKTQYQTMSEAETRRMIEVSFSPYIKNFTDTVRTEEALEVLDRFFDDKEIYRRIRLQKTKNPQP